MHNTIGTFAVLALLLASVGQAMGDTILSSHGEASISGPALLYGSGSNQTIDGDTTLLENNASGVVNGATVAGSAISHTVPNYSLFLGGQASSTQTSPQPGGTAYAATIASGAWRDVLFLTNGAAPLPSAVTFHFTVEGSMDYAYTPYSGGRTASFDDTFEAQVFAPSTTGFNAGGPATAIVDLIGYSDGGETTNISGFDSFTGSPLNFT
ncbi:MAG: hypothetical protein ACREHD_19770, partial [Pirellulales bacterium]